MTLHLYSLSGSPFGWKVLLALEHKGLPYQISYLSPDEGDLKTPWFRALNPHSKLPVLVDGDFVIFESDAVVEYLEDAFPAFGTSLWPRDVRLRAIARRIAIEASNYLYPPIRQLVVAIQVSGDSDPDPEIVANAKTAIAAQLAEFTTLVADGYFNGRAAGGADYAIYPLVALMTRLNSRRPNLGIGAVIPMTLLAWGAKIEELPFFARTYPPHWKA